jgi:hypothetical protein
MCGGRARRSRTGSWIDYYVVKSAPRSPRRKVEAIMAEAIMAEAAMAEVHVEAEATRAKTTMAEAEAGEGEEVLRVEFHRRC